MVAEVRRNLMAVEVVDGLGNLPGAVPLSKALGDIDLDQVKRLIQHVLGLIDGGDLGYTMITAAKC